MSEGRQFHIPVTPKSIEKLTVRLLKWVISFGDRKKNLIYASKIKN